MEIGVVICEHTGQIPNGPDPAPKNHTDNIAVACGEGNMTRIPTYADVEEAARRIADRQVRTPLFRAPVLSEQLGANIFIKPECMQRTGSFKFRGAWNAICALGDAAPAGVVACSSGNHAQGVAEAARLAGLPATIVMPDDAPEAKIARTRASGARIVLYERENEDRDAIAARITEETGAVFVHPFNNPDVVAGQGTVGLEIAADAIRKGIAPELVFVPCSGGGLGAGVNLGLSRAFPDAVVVLAEPEGFDDYRRSIACGKIVANERASGSLCDALLAAAPGEIGFAINTKQNARALAITDEAALAAAGLAYESWRLVVEPGGAAALAALLSGEIPVAGKTVAVVLSGGNADLAVVERSIATYRSSLA